MPLTFRNIAADCLAHLDESETSLEGTLPAGCLDYLVNVINTALQRMAEEAPQIFKQTLGLTWTAAVGGTITVAHGEPSFTLGSLAAPADGCTIQIGGDDTLNEVRGDPSGAGVFHLLHPYTGPSGAASATVYGDSVPMDFSISKILGCVLLHERRPLLVVHSRNEWMQRQGYLYGQDYGYSRIAAPPIIRTPGVPESCWIDNRYDPESGSIVYSVRCAPLPISNFRATLEVQCVPQEISVDDLGPQANSYAFAPGGSTYSTLRALALGLWTAAPWFANERARPMLTQEYQNAVNRLGAFKPSVAGQTMLIARP